MTVNSTTSVSEKLISIVGDTLLDSVRKLKNVQTGIQIMIVGSKPTFHFHLDNIIHIFLCFIFYSLYSRINESCTNIYVHFGSVTR